MISKENRATFFARVNHLPREDRLRLELAYTLAKFAHRAQTRKDEVGADGAPLRYFEHPRRTAIILMDEVNIDDPNLIMAALLHDGTEDTRDLTDEMIEFSFGHATARIVRQLSKNETNKDTYADWLLRFGSWDALLVKACDRLDNLRSMSARNTKPEFIAKQAKETCEIYYPIFERMVQSGPAELQGRLHDLFGKIRIAVGNLYSVL